MKKQNHYMVEEREIDVKEMFFHALSYWRSILIIAVIAAVVVGTMKYRSDVAAAYAQAYAQIEKENAPEITVEMLEDELSNEDVQDVWNAVQFEQLLRQRRTYIDSSIYLNLNAFKIKASYLTYNITGTEAVAAVSDMKSYLTGLELAKAAVEELGLDTEAVYIQELIQIEDNADMTAVTFRVAANNWEECDALTATVEKQLQTYVNGLKTKAEYADISAVCTESRKEVVKDEVLLAKQNEYIVGFYEDMKTYKKYDESFNNTQKSLFEKLTKGKYKIDNSLYSAETEVEETEKTEESGGDNNIDVQVTVKRDIVPYIAGFLAGAIAVFAIRAFFYTVSKNVHGEDEIKYLFGTNVFGVVDASGQAKKRLLPQVDRLLKRIKAGRHKSLSYETQMQLACTNILIHCKNHGIEKVHLSGSEMRKIPAVCIKTIKETLEKAGIEVSNGNGIAYDAESLMNLAEKKNGILVEISEKTGCAEIAKELNLCRQNEINVLGVVLVEIV